jgi:hypothetical protein
VPLTTHKGMWRIYSYPDPHGVQSINGYERNHSAVIQRLFDFILQNFPGLWHARFWCELCQLDGVCLTGFSDMRSVGVVVVVLLLSWMEVFIGLLLCM